MSDYGWYCVKTSIVLGGFFALVGLVCWWTTSGWPLWALLLTPSSSYQTKDGAKDD